MKKQSQAAVSTADGGAVGVCRTGPGNHSTALLLRRRRVKRYGRVRLVRCELRWAHASCGPEEAERMGALRYVWEFDRNCARIGGSDDYYAEFPVGRSDMPYGWLGPRPPWRRLGAIGVAFRPGLASLSRPRPDHGPRYGFRVCRVPKDTSIGDGQPDPAAQTSPSSAARPPLAVAPFNEKAAKQHQARWARHLGVRPVKTNSIGMKLVLIPPGEFDMGSSKEQIDEEKTAAPRR